jgi:hypothetical protein
MRDVRLGVSGREFRSASRRQWRRRLQPTFSRRNEVAWRLAIRVDAIKVKNAPRLCSGMMCASSVSAAGNKPGGDGIGVLQVKTSSFKFQAA